MGLHLLQHFASNWDDVLFGATAVGIVAHAVSSFPTPANKYGVWFLGVVQYAVGQRMRASNTLAGRDSIVVSETRLGG